MINEKIGGGGALISRPDLWPANTEIDFGGGLYGQRFTGTITASANTRDTKNLVATGVDAIVASGGTWQGIDGTDRVPINSTWFDSSGTEKGRGTLDRPASSHALRMLTFDSVARTNMPYDVWALYTKTS